MSLYLLDTNAISDVISTQPLIQSRFVRHRFDLLTSVVVRGEIRYGIERLPLGRRRTLLETITDSVLAVIPTEEVTIAIADRYGALRRDVESRGLACDDNDLWIAATALNIGAIVVTRDQDMRRMPGLAIEDWTK
jgi:tRNA(fMet)-specific endonuclease VapC